MISNTLIQKKYFDTLIVDICYPIYQKNNNHNLHLLRKTPLPSPADSNKKQTPLDSAPT